MSTDVEPCAGGDVGTVAIPNMATTDEKRTGSAFCRDTENSSAASAMGSSDGHPSVIASGTRTAASAQISAPPSAPSSTERHRRSVVRAQSKALSTPTGPAIHATAPDRRGRLVVVSLALALVAVFIWSFTAGKYGLTVTDTLKVIAHTYFGAPADYDPACETVFLQVRMPRIFCCVFVGAALAAAGATFQGIFKNPMVSPDLLGASSGSAFGACLGILLGFSYFKIHIVAFALGLAAVGITYAVAAAVSRGSSATTALILTGMVVSALFNAGVQITQRLANSEVQLGEITFWLMGSMTHLTYASLPILGVPVLIGLVPLFLMRYRLNVLSFGEEEAAALGLNVRALRAVLVVGSTLVTSASVACCGIVGWLGLVIPHLLRLVVGPDYKVLLPASVFGGALFLLAVDNITRIFFTTEISIGILTSLIGAPFFLVLLLRGRQEWV